jgi:hypothetical protein
VFSRDVRCIREWSQGGRGRGRGGVRWRRGCPARHSTPITRLHRRAIALGPLPVRSSTGHARASQYSGDHRRWCGPRSAPGDRHRLLGGRPRSALPSTATAWARRCRSAPGWGRSRSASQQPVAPATPTPPGSRTSARLDARECPTRSSPSGHPRRSVALSSGIRMTIPLPRSSTAYRRR